MIVSFNISQILKGSYFSSKPISFEEGNVVHPLAKELQTVVQKIQNGPTVIGFSLYESSYTISLTTVCLIIKANKMSKKGRNISQKIELKGVLIR